MVVIPRIGGCGLKFLAASTIAIIYKCHPPHRGMWIEISSVFLSVKTSRVIPRIGGCGLKCVIAHGVHRPVVSHPPHRGMWIEIVSFLYFRRPTIVIPRIGGCGLKYRRSKRGSYIRVIPHIGGCGLKSQSNTPLAAHLMSSPT